MNKLHRRWTARLFLGFLAVAAVSFTGGAQERDRAKIPDKYKWNLAEIYPSNEAWRSAKDKLAGELPSLRQFEGTLGSSAATLADALSRMYALDKELSRLYVYASMLSDQDTRDAQHRAMQQEMVQLAASFGAQVSFVEPEILRIERATLDAFIASEPRLEGYTFYLRDIVRRARHTLNDREEKILADVAPLASSPSNTFGILSNADFPYPTVTLSDGKAVKIDQAAYDLHRASPSRVDREKVMSAFFNALGSFGRTYGTTMNASVQKALFFSKSRTYGSSLEMVLDSPNIPVSVYTRLVDGVNRHLPTFHRYLKLRKQMMGVDQLHYYDLYAPLVASVNLTYTPEEAQEQVLAAMAPLGADYISVLKRAFSERWIDLLPNEGKRTGAYSNGGAYDVHPYMLINYNGKYNDVSTVAHELGHTMHSYYSNRTQPYATASYPLFVAEVASTFNEAFLIDHMLRNITDDATRLSVLGNYLEGIKGTVFRQTQFAEFELRMHEMAQKGQPITGEALAKLYMEITKRYYGHDEGVTIVDDYIAHEWSFVPHFYRDFYVFQYATSYTASAALAENARAPGAAGEAARKRYLAFLGAGGSRYPIDLLRDAGVDMTTDAPLEATMRQMNRVMDEMEKLFARRAPAGR
jgi:oligoendopeptidase F